MEARWSRFFSSFFSCYGAKIKTSEIDPAWRLQSNICSTSISANRRDWPDGRITNRSRGLNTWDTLAAMLAQVSCQSTQVTRFVWSYRDWPWMVQSEHANHYYSLTETPKYANVGVMQLCMCASLFFIFRLTAMKEQSDLLSITATYQSVLARPFKWSRGQFLYLPKSFQSG